MDLTPAKWRFEILNPDGNEFVIGSWSPITITENFDGCSMSFSIPSARPELQYITELVSDIVAIRNNVPFARFRVMDSDDDLTSEAHNVTLICQSYEKVLRLGKILLFDFEESGDQHDLAWQMISDMQARQTLHLTRAADSGTSGTSRSRTINRGSSIAEAIDNVASVAGGFDWWITPDLEVHFATPRRETTLNRDWKWGANVARVRRGNSAENYHSAILVLGSLNEVTIPGGDTYPPPDPVMVEADSMPVGRWEKTFSYPDVLTTASLESKAAWHINDGATPRPTYTIEMEPGAWDIDVRPGTIVSLRVQNPPRLNFRVPIRVEELTITLSPAGAETVSVAARAEERETILEGSAEPILNEDVNNTPIGTDVVTVAPPDGMTVVSARVSPTSAFAAYIRDIGLRVARRERTL